MKTLTASVALLALVLSTPAVAEETAAETAAKNTNQAGYGQAGCGLGSILFGAKPGFMQVFAATTNGTFNSQTFGITTGTSNCVDPPGATASARLFIRANREALARDIARGGGEAVASLSAVAGCADASAVGRKLQNNFSSVFPDASISTDKVSDVVIGTLQSDAALACGNLSG